MFVLVFGRSIPCKSGLVQQQVDDDDDELEQERGRGGVDPR